MKFIAALSRKVVKLISKFSPENYCCIDCNPREFRTILKIYSIPGYAIQLEYIYLEYSAFNFPFTNRYFRICRCLAFDTRLFVSITNP
jgi:hypothetical protein